MDHSPLASWLTAYAEAAKAAREAAAEYAAARGLQ